MLSFSFNRLIRQYLHQAEVLHLFVAEVPQINREMPHGVISLEGNTLRINEFEFEITNIRLVNHN